MTLNRLLRYILILAFALAILIQPQTCPGQAARLVKDISPGESSDGLGGVTIVGVNGTIFWNGKDPSGTWRCWKNEVTPEGAVPTDEFVTCPTQWTRVGANFFFFERPDGGSLWRSDGTAGGSIRIRDLTAGWINGVADLDGVLIFAQSNGTGEALWRSDGTTEGTHPIKEGIRLNDYFQPVSLNGQLYFSAAESLSADWELWKTDGTTEGTVLVKDIFPGPTGSHPTSFTVSGGVMFFLASFESDERGETRKGIWKTNGTTEGTVLIHEGEARIGGGFRRIGWGLTDVNGTVYFAFTFHYSGGYDLELWKTDGTTKGTSLVKELGAWEWSSLSVEGRPGPLSFGGYVFFVFNGALWRSDGSPEGTIELKDADHAPFPAGTTLYFGSGQGLWKTDGTREGTVAVKQDAGFVVRGSFAEVFGKLVFTAIDSEHGWSLWQSDGTREGTRFLADLFAGPASSGPSNLVALDETLLFSATDGIAGHELWRSDGTSEGTFLVKDVYPGPDGRGIQPLGTVGKTLYFRAFDALHGSEIWKSDGTSEGTLLVLDVNSGSDGSVVGCLANCQRGASPWGIALEGVLFFNAFDNTTGLELWRTDGSPQGTRLVKDIFPGEGGSFPGEARGVKSLLYFAATDELHGTELWKSDGTPEGTVLIKDVEPGGAGSYPSDLVELNGRLFFLASDGVGQYRPWVSDGTDAGTIPLTGPSFRLPADSGLRPGRHALPAKAGGTLFFAVEGFPQLWRTDGTPEGTAQVPDLASWLGNPSSLEPLSVRGQLFVLVAYPWGEKTLWKITEEADLTFDQVASDPCLRIWLALDGTLLFTTGCGARALWISNGTLEGTLMLEEFTAVQSPGENFTRAGETLFFSLSDPVHGNELWSMDLSEILEQWDTRLPIHRGDPNSSGTTDIADGVTIFGFLFLGDPPALSCRESADSNNDGTIDISDGIYLLNWLFTGGPEPATPGPTGAPCGVDPDGEGSPGDLGCTEYPPCQ